MSTRAKCKGCEQPAVTEVRQIRIYSRTKQHRFRMVLCATCFGALFDLLVASAQGYEEGLWSPLQTEVLTGVRKHR